MLTPSPVPAAIAIVGRGRKLRWKVAVPAMKAPIAAEVASEGPLSASVGKSTSPTATAPRSARLGSVSARSRCSPVRVVSRRAANQDIRDSLGQQ